MHAKERKHKSAKERFHVKIANNQLFETTRFENSQFVFWEKETAEISPKSLPFLRTQPPGESAEKIHESFLESRQSGK